VTYFEVLLQTLPGRTEENHEKIQLIHPVSGQDLNPESSAM